MRCRCSFGILAGGLALMAVAGSDALATDYDQELSRIGKELIGCLTKDPPPKIAALDFTDLQGDVTALGRLLSEELSTELAIIGGNGGPSIMDRNHLRTILKEHELNASGLVDTETTKKLGSFAGIDVVVTGTVLALDENIRMTVKAISTETATIACAARGEFPKTMAMRELLGVGVAMPADRNHGAAEAKRAEAGAAAFKDARIGVELVSLVKSRDGRNATVTLSLTNPQKKALGLLLSTSEPTLMTDNTGATWVLKRSAGILDGSQRRSRDVEPFKYSLFPPNVPQLVTLLFEVESMEGSAGTVFAITGTLKSCPDASCYQGTDEALPFGLRDIEVR